MTRILPRSIVLLAAGVGLLLPPRLAAAQSLTPLPPLPPPQNGHAGLVLGLSVGYAAPEGNATTTAGDTLGGTFAFQIPLTLDLGVNIFPSLFLGVYGTFADGGPGSSLTFTCSQENCSQISFRGGVVVEYRLLPGRTFEPWIGYGFGYDTSSASVSSVNEYGYTLAQSARTLSGWDLGHARIGLDFLIDPFSAAGVFADVGFGKFTHEWTQIGAQPGLDQTLSNAALHEWLTIGMRWTFMP